MHSRNALALGSSRRKYKPLNAGNRTVTRNAQRPSNSVTHKHLRDLVAKATSVVSSSSFVFSSLSPRCNPNFVVDISFFQSNTLSSGGASSSTEFEDIQILAQIVQERRRGHDGEILADVEHVILPLHVVNVFLHTDLRIPDFEVNRNTSMLPRISINYVIGSSSFSYSRFVLSFSPRCNLTFVVDISFFPFTSLGSYTADSSTELRHL